MQSATILNTKFADSVHDSLLSMAEISANRLLTFDELALKGCTELQGTCITIHITDLEFHYYCHPGAWGIRLSRNPPPRAADASICGRLMALLALSTTTDKVSTSIQEQVSFQGNVALAQKLQQVFTGLDIDWEEALARYSGDILAFQMVKGAGLFCRWLQQSKDSVLQTSSEYLREEARLSPTKTEFKRFRSQLTELKQDLARSEVRLEHLLAKSDRRNA